LFQYFQINFVEVYLLVWVNEIDTQKNGIFTQTLYIFFEAVNYHTKKTKKTKQSAFHTD